MPNQTWLDEVQHELLRRRLPRHEVARLVAELTDHLADVAEMCCATDRTSAEQEESRPSLSPSHEVHMSMDANVTERLGSPADVAESALREFHQRRSVLSRSPLAAFCTFVLLPLPALCLAWAASMALIAAFVAVANWFSPGLWRETDGKLTQAFAGHVLLILTLVVPAACVAILFGRLAGKTEHIWRWGLAACVLVALGATTGNVWVTYSDVPGKSQVFLGFGIGRNSFMRLSQLGQFLIPLATGVLVLRRSTRSAPMSSEMAESKPRETSGDCASARAA